jgi:hypothetical protein
MHQSEFGRVLMGPRSGVLIPKFASFSGSLALRRRVIETRRCPGLMIGVCFVHQRHASFLTKCQTPAEFGSGKA